MSRIYMQQIKVGQEIGMWEFELYFAGSSVLSRTLALRLNGRQQNLVPDAFIALIRRDPLGYSSIVNSQEMAKIFPTKRHEANFAIQNEPLDELSVRHKM